MIDIKKFNDARIRVLSEQSSAGGIGTLGEKTLHRILKSYIEPDESLHEIKYLGSVADIKNSEGIFEIQTASYEKLIPKLEKFLQEDTVTVVSPIVVNKRIRFIDKDTGEITEPKLSPKHEGAIDALRKLYRIRRFLFSERIRIRLLYLEAEEYKYLDGWDKSKRRGATRIERIPTALLDDFTVSER